MLNEVAAWIELSPLVSVAQEQDFDTQPGPLWLLGQVGIIGAISTVFGMLHKSAIKAYKEVAETYQKIADIERKRADTSNAQVLQLLDPIRKASDAM